MNDEELREMAGRALGLTRIGMRTFNPLLCDRQTLEVAQALMMNVNIDSFNRQTVIMQLDPGGLSTQLLVERHDAHNNNPALATRYAVLRAAAAIGALSSVVIEPPVGETPNRKESCYKHGLRITKAKAQEAVAV
jgi:hypothetical protein